MTNINLLQINPAAQKVVIQTVRDMFNKKLLPERSRKIILDSMPSLIKQFQSQKFKEFSCTTCGFTAMGPKFLLNQHQKIHADKKDIKENENLSLDYKLY